MPVSRETSVTKDNNLNDVVLTAKSFPLLHDAYLYDENGEVVLTSDPQKKSVLKKGKTISSLQNGHVYVIKGVKFYQVGKNQYVKVANTVLQGPKRLQLKHNAFVYDQNGKRVKKSKLLKEGTVLSALNGAEKFKLKNKTYYQVGKNQYVKVANTL